MNAQVNQNQKAVDNKNSAVEDKNVSIKSLKDQKATLLAKFQGDETPTQEDFSELNKINSAIKKMIDNRQNVINDIKGIITNQEFSILDIFTADELKAGGYVASVIDTTNAKAQKKSRTTKSYQSDSNSVLIHIPVEANEFQTAKPLEYKKGRINEPYDDKVKTAWNVSALPAKFAKYSTEESLKKFFTDDGKTYFATPEGKAELTKLVELLTKLAPAKQKAIKAAKDKYDAEKLAKTNKA